MHQRTHKVAIDYKIENLIPIAETPLWLQERFGLTVDRTTIYRWHSRGVRGVKLETLQLGSKRFTSKEALERFIEATNSRKP